MAMNTGTLDLTSLLAVTYPVTAGNFGIDKIAAVLAADNAAFNRIVREDLMSSLVDPTTDRQRIYGASTTGTMMEVDEYSRGPTQKQVVPPSVGFPLRLYQWPVGWTDKWFQTKSPADLAIQQQGAQVAFLRVLQREIKKALFLSANYTWVDFLVDGVSVAVKRLLNADSAAIPLGPNGEVFTASTHTHYIGSATLTAAAVQSAIDTVVEHGVRGPIIVAISTTDEAAFRALTGFLAAADPRLIFAPGGTVDRVPVRVNTLLLNNRLIGYFGAAEVWVKSWAIANYVVVYDADPANKPLAMRERTSGSGGLRIAAELAAFPLNATYQEAEFGLGVWNRTKAAVLYFANATYADPTIV